jgi:phosphatidylglycerophosphatase A
MDSITSMQTELDPGGDAAAPDAFTESPPIEPGLDARFMWSHPLHAISLGLGSGLAPMLPGATGTLFGWATFIILNRYLSPLQWAVLITVGFFAGIVSTGYTAKRIQQTSWSGPTKAIVWDHVVAFWLVLLMVTPCSFFTQLCAFLLFRFFDTVTLPPVRYYRRRLRGGARIMVDDAVAAFLTLIVIAVWRH